MIEENNFNINLSVFEFIGIELGDGNIYVGKWQHQLDISVNPVDDPKYVIHVKNLMEEIFSKEVNITEHPGKGASLRLYGKEIVQYLLDLGLQAGSKTLNQVSVPQRIFEHEIAIIRCLKGLFDTDGGIGIDSPRDLRLTFTNSSKPLVEDFYNMCHIIGIEPSPTIKYDEGKNSSQVVIAKKDEIKKFLNIVKPEKWKEPYRRVYIASILIYLNSPENVQQEMKKRMSNWLERTNQHQFRYTKDNAEFIKSLCERLLNIKITTEVINKALTEVLELEKFMYSGERAQKLKYLYEKLRSVKRIAECLIDQGETLIPHRQTVTRHLRRYFEEINQDYDTWQLNYPKMRIGINEHNEIRVFPHELRNSLNILIIEIIKENQNVISDFGVLKILKQKFVEMDMLIMIWLLRNSKFNIAIENYLKTLIYFCKILVHISTNNINLNITELTRDHHIQFDRRTLTLMIDYLIEEGIISF